MGRIGVQKPREIGRKKKRKKGKSRPKPFFNPPYHLGASGNKSDGFGVRVRSAVGGWLAGAGAGAVVGAVVAADWYGLYCLGRAGPGAGGRLGRPELEETAGCVRWYSANKLQRCPELGSGGFGKCLSGG